MRARIAVGRRKALVFLVSSLAVAATATGSSLATAQSPPEARVDMSPSTPSDWGNTSSDGRGIVIKGNGISHPTFFRKAQR